MNPKKIPPFPWWAIGLSFALFWPLGIVLLIANLSAESGSSSQASRTSGPRQRQSVTTHTSAGTAAGRTATQSAPSGQGMKKEPGPLASLRESIDKKLRSGRLMSILGGVFGGLFLITLVSELGQYGLGAVGEWFPFFGLTVGGFYTMLSGISRSRLGRRQRLYLGVIGNKKSVFLSDLAAAAGVSERKVEKDLEKMLGDGTLPIGYLDRASGRLVLTEEGYTPPEPEKTAVVRGEATQEDKDRAILLQIRAINDAIPGDEMSRKIDRVEEITGKILAYAREHPDRSRELRQFLNYYLPTTLKILNAYAQMDAQGVDGENITATKRRIEAMMDKVVDGFEKQLDQLFRGDAMDITSDVEVLERMLAKDGLQSSKGKGGQAGEGITLTLGG